LPFVVEKNVGKLQFLLNI